MQKAQCDEGTEDTAWQDGREMSDDWWSVISDQWSEIKIWDVPQESLRLLSFDSWLAVLLKPFGYGIRPIAVLLDFDKIYNIHRGNKKNI